ncbi:hypothetical protein C2857_003472 [Epichloe festucae Fl1]|uniref:PB1 domain-containing protein n=2 Tax=Epichloe festucae TaxID=35717 RepID=A0A7S9KKA7_EPIFF|nr:hypothetical protein C2857_003472 [Epichloe festucae Fl1]BAF36501.1 NADPH oxidase regulator NoxR [Epichloe festucae]
MSLKLEIETWVAALARYDNNEFDDALGEFDKICDTSKILFNMGVIHATLGEHEKAVECYQRAIRLDQYLAVAYFQQGVSNFLLGDFEEALANFNDTLLYLRGNTMIDYAQLGLLFKLYSCEVLFNRGLCYIYLQQQDVGMQDLTYAVKEKVVEDHNVIDEAIREEAEGYTVFSIPVGVVYRPNEAKVRNLKTKDYLGKARLVAASDRSNAFTGFTGSEIKNAGKMEVKDDRPADNISFAATNLVKPGIQSRRQQPEPSANRNVFPPTPPPDNDRPSRGSSVRNGSRPMPAKLTIQTQDSNRKYEKAPSPEEVRATRSAASSTPSQGFSRRDHPPIQRRPTRRIDEMEEADAGDLYDMYQGSGSNRRTSRDSRRPSVRSRTQPRYYDDDDGSDYDDGSLDGAEFEMVSNNRRRQGSRSESRATSRRPEIRKIRVKVHAGDVRYIMIGAAIEYPDFVDRIKDKFGMKRRFKIKIPDEDMPDGDMITVGDQDDLEMAIQSSTSLAKRQRQDVAKMEIWIFEL